MNLVSSPPRRPPSVRLAGWAIVLFVASVSLDTPVLVAFAASLVDPSGREAVVIGAFLAAFPAIILGTGSVMVLVRTWDVTLRVLTRISLVTNAAVIAAFFVSGGGGAVFS